MNIFTYGAEKTRRRWRTPFESGSLRGRKQHSPYSWEWLHMWSRRSTSGGDCMPAPLFVVSIHWASPSTQSKCTTQSHTHRWAARGVEEEQEDEERFLPAAAEFFKSGSRSNWILEISGHVFLDCLCSCFVPHWISLASSSIQSDLQFPHPACRKFNLNIRLVNWETTTKTTTTAAIDNRQTDEDETLLFPFNSFHPLNGKENVWRRQKNLQPDRQIDRTQSRGQEDGLIIMGDLLH